MPTPIAAIYWYPSTSGGLKKIRLTEPFSDAQEVFDERFGDSAYSGDLDQARIDFGGRSRVRIIYERTMNRTLVAQFRSLESHLKRGGAIGVACDETKAYAAFCDDYTMSAGSSALKLNGNIFWPYNYVNYPPVGPVSEFYAIRSQNPGYIEEHPFSTFDPATGIATMNGEQLYYDHSIGPVFVRHSTFWPVCYLDPASMARPLVTTDHGINWTLDLDLVDATGDFASLYQETGGNGTTVGNSDYYNPFGTNVPGNSLAGEYEGVFSGNRDSLLTGGAADINASGLNTLQQLINNGKNSTGNSIITNYFSYFGK